MSRTAHIASEPSGSLAHVDRHPATLTAEQLMAAELVAQHGFQKTQDELAAIVGVARTTLWRWRQDPTFRRAILQFCRRLPEEAVGEAYQQLVMAMRAGRRWAIEKIIELDQEAAGVRQDRRLAVYREVLLICGIPAVAQEALAVAQAVGSGRLVGSAVAAVAGDSMTTCGPGGPAKS